MVNQNVLDALKMVTEALTASAGVLTCDNVKEGEYFVVTRSAELYVSNFLVGEVVKLVDADGSTRPMFANNDGASWYHYLGDMRRATPDEIAKAFPDVKLIDGKTYEKVAKAREGDYIMFDEVPTRYFTAGKLYEVYDLDCGDAIIHDNDGDNYDTEDDDFTAYRLVEAIAPVDDSFIEVDGLRYDKVEGTPKVGDYIVAAYDFTDITVGEYYKVYNLDHRDRGLIHDDAGDSRFVNSDRIKAVYRRELSEREESFVKFGRKDDEFKVGDLVQIVKKPTNSNGYDVVGSIHEIDEVRSHNVHLKYVTPRKDNNGTNTEFNDIKLVAPVERLS